ncbi:MAG: hypothetical protein KY464_02035 [Gemmatimonadetes bacterium]|nr:hypothetical protein [Gemmatimonadota bacterium]
MDTFTREETQTAAVICEPFSLPYHAFGPVATRLRAIFERRGEEPPEWCVEVLSTAEPYPSEQQARDREVLALDRAARGIVVEGAKEEFARRLDTIATRQRMARGRGLET